MRDSTLWLENWNFIKRKSFFYLKSMLLSSWKRIFVTMIPKYFFARFFYFKIFIFIPFYDLLAASENTFRKFFFTWNNVVFSIKMDVVFYFYFWKKFRFLQQRILWGSILWLENCKLLKRFLNSFYIFFWTFLFIFFLINKNPFQVKLHEK